MWLILQRNVFIYDLTLSRLWLKENLFLVFFVWRNRTFAVLMIFYSIYILFIWWCLNKKCSSCQVFSLSSWKKVTTPTGIFILTKCGLSLNRTAAILLRFKVPALSWIWGPWKPISFSSSLASISSRKSADKIHTLCMTQQTIIVSLASWMFLMFIHPRRWNLVFSIPNSLSITTRVEDWHLL